MVQPSDSALNLLRLLLGAAIGVPLLFLAVLGWSTYHAAFEDATREISWTSDVAREHAARVFDSQELVAERIIDLLRGLSDDAIRQSEHDLYTRLKAMISELPQIESLLVLDRTGHALVATGAYPVDRQQDFSDRDYFVALKAGGTGTFISRVQISRVQGHSFFGLGRARRSPTGDFDGVVDIAIAPKVFSDFYNTLLHQESVDVAGRVLTMIRADGQVLVRYPPFAGPLPVVPHGNPFFEALHRNPVGGSYVNRSVVDKDAPLRRFAYRKVQDYPLYIVAGRSVSTIVGDWQSRMLRALAAVVPAAAILFVVTLEALRRTQREQQALAQAHAEMQRREQAEAALRRSQRLEAVGQLTGGIAHDFNNLLTIIIGNVDMMVRRAEDPARVRRLGETVLAAARRVAEVTDKLLVFSRRHFARSETLDLNALLIEFRPLLARAVNAQVVVDYALASDLAPVRLDPGQFEAALINLVVNARDAMPQGGRLTIATALLRIEATDRPEAAELAPGSYVSVSVTDTGSGMDEATLAKAFEPFFTTKAVGKGTGLGLSQVYGFTRQAGGQARIISRPGAGTRVELILPRSDEAPPAERGKTEVAPPTRPRRGETVLVVEDEAAVLDVAVETLQELGYRVLTARNAAAALAHLATEPRIDLMFTDLVMPGDMDGLKLSLEARRLRPGICILLTSGYAEAGRLDALPANLPLLRKPYRRGELAAEIGRILVAAEAPPISA